MSGFARDLKGASDAVNSPLGVVGIRAQLELLLLQQGRRAKVRMREEPLHELPFGGQLEIARKRRVVRPQSGILPDGIDEGYFRTGSGGDFGRGVKDPIRVNVGHSFEMKSLGTNET